MARKTRLLALISSLSAANVAFRLAFSSSPYTLPNIKPVAFLVILGGIVGGPAAGAAIGILSMTIGDLVIGAGIWTVETSAGMAVVGLLGGLLWHRATEFNRWKLAVSGYVLAMIFDIGTSIADAFIFSYPWISAILALYIPFLSAGFSPYPFGLVHELTTAVLMATLGPTLIRRVRKLYQ